MAGTIEAAVAPRAESSQGLYTKLSPGPGKSEAEVADHQRARIQSAMIALVAERGYDGVTLRNLASVAKVSSRAFYERFGGKEDCFLRTHELIVHRMAKRVVASQAGERDWEQRLRLAFGAFVRELEREPQAARLVLVEAYVDGPAARAQARHSERIFEALLADSFGRAPDGIAVSPFAVEGMVAAVAELLRRRLFLSEVSPEAELADELVDWTLACRQCVTALPAAKPVVLPSSKASMGSRSSMADRDLLLAAVEKLVANEEADRLTVSRIRSAAGVSRQSFDAHFDDADDCVSAAAQRRVDETIAFSGRALSVGSSRQTQVEESVLAFCGTFAREPVLAKLCSAELLGGASRNLHISARITDGIATFGHTGSPSVFTEATAAMVCGIIRNRIYAGCLESLPRIAPDLAASAAALFERHGR